jgi:two-component system, OmpR family, response regulator
MPIETKKTVLLVDDDEDFLFQNKFQLEKMGFSVESASTQDEARQILSRIRPDLAVLDLMMDRMDAGFVLSYLIKKKDPTIPVILVTAVTSETGLEFDSATDEEKNWVKADVVLAKPVRFEQLEREIHRLLNAG